MKTIETELFFCGKLVKYEVPVKNWKDLESEIEPGSNTLILKMENGYIFIDLAGSGNRNLVAIKYI